MEIFVTGATGVLGRATVLSLLAAGHRVRRLARSAASDTLLRQLGVAPVAVDLADAAGLRAALSGCDAMLHLATKIPPSSAARKGASWRENDRLRRAGTNALMDAALAAGVPTLIYPSVALLYPDSGERWLVAGESAVKPTPNLLSTLVAEDAVARFTAAGGRGITLRLGNLYGPTASSARELLALVRRGIAPLPGAAGAYPPSLPAEGVALAESLSLAFLTVLERLNPVERAIFLLHDVFGYEFAEIAPIVERETADCRQIARRARASIHSARPRYPLQVGERERLTREFMRVCTLGDLPALVATLADDITVWPDGGGRVQAARKPVRGAEKAARFLPHIVADGAAQGVAFTATTVNGQPRVLIRAPEGPYGVVALDIAAGKVREIAIMINPEKLRHLMAAV